MEKLALGRQYYYTWKEEKKIRSRKCRVLKESAEGVYQVEFENGQREIVSQGNLKTFKKLVGRNYKFRNF